MFATTTRWRTLSSTAGTYRRGRKIVALSAFELVRTNLRHPLAGAGAWFGVGDAVRRVLGRSVTSSVFVSHTSELREFPEGESFVDGVEAAIIRAGDAVIDMAYFPARDEAPASVCREAVRSADVYVLIAGFRYGSPVRDEPDLSYTELEFKTATEIRIPRLVFLIGEGAQGPAGLFLDPDYGSRQQVFRAHLLESGIVVAMVRDSGELQIAVLHSLMEQRSRRMGRRLARVWSVPRLRGDEVNRLELTEALVAAVVSADAGAVGVTTGLVGAGGFGKTTLARMVAHDPRIRRHFTDGVIWVSIGEDASGPDLAAKLISAARLLEPGVAEVTDSSRPEPC